LGENIDRGLVWRYSLPAKRTPVFSGQGEREIQVLAQAEKSQMNLAETRAAFKDQPAVRCAEMIEDQRTIVVFFDKIGSESLGGGGKADQIFKSRFVFVGKRSGNLH
jgi:hypothetical protein